MKKGFVVGLATGLTIASASLVLANSQIQAILNNQIKVSLNGQVQEFRDETSNEVQYSITYKDRTYLPLRTVANLVGVDVDYDADNNTAILKNDFNLRNDLDNLDFSNSLECDGWEISLDGKIIKRVEDVKGEDVINTNLTKNIKSIKAVYGSSIHYIVLTEDGEVYYSYAGQPFEFFGDGYDGVSGFSYYGGGQQTGFVAKKTVKWGGENDDEFKANEYTIFTDKEHKIIFSDGI